jgi:protein-S-isoprenylcysteine O-methyltransferase Ste14
MNILQSGFLPVFIAVMLFGIIHSALAAHRTKAFIDHRLGIHIRRWYRLAFNIIAGLTLLPALILVVSLPDSTLYRIPLPWVFLTLCFQGLAAGGLLLGVRQTGAAAFLGFSQFTQEGETSQSLVTTGFYRWVRHPLYTFSLAIIWLMPMMTWNILSFDISATLYLTIGTLFEERKLAAEFGQAYIAYRRQTPMLLPLKLRRRE